MSLMVKLFLAMGLIQFATTFEASTYIGASFVNYWSKFKILNIDIFNIIKFVFFAVAKKRKKVVIVFKMA